MEVGMAHSIYVLCGNVRRLFSRRLTIVCMALGVVACASWIGLHPPGSVAAEARARAAWGLLPLSFEPNQGQSHPEVQFLSRGNGYALFLTSTEAVLVLRAPGVPDGGTVVRMELVGARRQAEARGLRRLPGRSSYFVGNDPQKWRTDVPTYARVEYRDVYPGIDLVYYGTQGRLLEYDFTVAPGADPTAIVLRFHGGDEVAIDADGHLALRGAGGGIRLHKPVAYQLVDGARKEVAAAYVLKGDAHVGFRVAAYDRSAPLIIDPVVTAYATFLGGNAIDQGFGIAVDAAGNAYVTGNTVSTDFPTTAGSVQPAMVAGTEAFVAKLNAAGTALIYSTYLGGNLDDAGRGIALDSAGNVVITGFTTSFDFPVTAGAAQPTFGGLTDAFVSKLNATGSVLLYSTYLGGAGVDIGLGVAVDGSGSAYVTGGTRPLLPTIVAPDFPTTVGAFQVLPGGGTCGADPCRDAFVTKFDSTGAVVYSTLVGGGADDAGSSIAVDGAGNASLTGFTQSLNFPTTAGALQSTLLGTTDAFVTRLNPAGSALLYSTYLGGSGVDTGNGIALDGSGVAYLTGTTASANFPTVGAGFPTAGAGFTGLGEAFVTKLVLAAGAVPIYSRSLLSQDVGTGIAVDSAGNALITGTELRCSVADAFGSCLAFNTDAFVVKVDPVGAIVFSLFLGGSRDDTGQAIAVDSAGNPYVTGDTTSADFPPTPSAFQTFLRGTDAFVVKLVDVPATGVSSDGNGSGCFIATAAFGSPLVREVQVLREFRDRMLLTSAPGRLLVRAYYRMSPPLARLIATSDGLRAATRGTLRPVIWVARLALARPAQTWMLGAGGLAVGVLAPLSLLAARRRPRRIFLLAFVLLCVAAGGAFMAMDRAERHTPVPEASVPSNPVPAPRELRPAPRSSGPAFVTPAPGRVRIREISPGRYEVRGAEGLLADLDLMATPLPSLQMGLRVRISSVVGDGILTELGLTVTDPKLSARAGIQVGDTILSVNGFPARQFHVALLAMRRDPDRGSLELQIDRQGMRLTQVYVMR
jgi:hypothetical protein